MLAVLAPGQGSQTAGFLAPWRAEAGVDDRLRWYSAVVGLDLAALGSDPAPADLVDTAAVQPLLVAAGLAVAPLLGELPANSVLAGHSVGEVTAAVLAGALDEAAGLSFVRERGRAMAAAAAAHPGGLVAVLGGEAAEVAAAAAAVGCHVANVNGAGQLVVGGAPEDLARLAPPPGARLRPLAVAGAFHTPHMVAARDRLRPLAAGLPAVDPRLAVLSNADGALVPTGAALVERLVAQVAAPVRFDLCLEAMDAMGVTAVVELPPAGTLTGLVLRALPGVRTVALRTPADLPAAAALVAEHAATADTPAPAWRLLVAPTAGVFHRQDVAAGRALRAGETVGRVVSPRQETDVHAAHGGVLLEWLAVDGDPVQPGQPLARLHPHSIAGAP